MIRRIISILLNIYILLLTLTPCADMEIPCNDTAYACQIMNDVPVHQESHDCCSPFCTCSCCNLPFEVVTSFIIPSTYYDLGTIAYFLPTQFQSHYLFSIWEPPKA